MINLFEDTVKNTSLIFSNRNRFTLLSLLVLLNVVLRVPWSSYEVGTDTFFIHALAASISRFGSAKWLIHPASVFGLYPFSYPSAQPFILSGLSQSSNISIASVLLLYSIFLSLLGLFSSYILAKELFNDDLYAIIISFLYSLSPLFLELTYWQASTRSLFVSVFPLIIWTLVKNKNKFRIKYWVMSFVGVIFLFSAHRVAFFSLVIIFGYVLTIIFDYLLKKQILNLSSRVTKTHLFYILLILSCILFFSQFTPFGVFDLSNYQAGILRTGDDFPTLLINMIVDYIGKVGIVVPFVLIGFIKIAKGGEEKFEEFFILFNFILLLPLMGSDTYSPLPLSIFLAILSAVGLITVVNYVSSERTIWTSIHLNIWPDIYKRITTKSLKSGVYKNSPLLIFAFVCIVSTVIFSLFMIDHEHLYKDPVGDVTFASVNFIKDKSNSTLIANTGFLASATSAYSSDPVLPLGGPYAQFAPPGSLQYGFVDKTEFSVTPLNISDISSSIATLYELESSRNANDEWTNVMEKPYWSKESKDIRSMYNANLVVEAGHFGKYLYWSWRDSSLLKSLYESGNKIYDTNGGAIYSIPENTVV